MRLTEEQVIFFNEKGYLILQKFAVPEQCNTILDIAKAHLKHKVPPIETELEYVEKSKEERRSTSDGDAQKLEKRMTVRRLRQVYHRDIVFREWMENQEIRPLLKQILGENLAITIAHHNSIMTKMPFSSTETSWHQDIRYWNFENDNLISVWLALGEENSDNGVLEFIPGSHKMVLAPDQFGEKEYFLTNTPQNVLLIDTKEQIVLEKGDVVFFHCKLLHRANANHTKNPKISFVYTVRDKSNEPIPQTRSSAFADIILK